jgi:glyoxylase-like metal-dependent hydrolase (beta-lactamase superfamily II)
VVIDVRERASGTSRWRPFDLSIENEIQPVRRWQYVEYADSRPYATFMSHYDLFGDGAVVLISLAGHTAGTQGAVIRTPNTPVLLTGDAALMEGSWRFGSKPLWASEMRLWWENVWRVKKFAELEPRLVVVPGHDLSVLSSADHDSVVFHTQREQE